MFQFIGNASCTMFGSRPGQTFDYKLTVTCYVHLHTAGHAHAPRPFRRVVDFRKRLLQIWVICSVFTPFDDILWNDVLWMVHIR